MSLEFVLYQLPLVQGIALRAGAILMDPMLEVEIGGGYIRQESRRRAAELNK